ncbi:MAG: PAS domain S-box protein [Chloroflexi bacterium]|nr:PAS domain S-box protein [Chloroflexota bacterium]
MKNVTFRRRQFLILVAVAMIALLPAALMGIVIAQTSVIRRTTVQMETMADLKAAEVQSWLEQGRQAAQLSANLHEMQGHLLLLSNALDGTTQVQTDLLVDLKAVAGTYDYLRSISLLHPISGRVLLSTDPAQRGHEWRGGEETFRQGQRAMYVSPITFTGGGESPMLYVSAPVRDESGTLLAVVVVEMNVAGLQALFENRTGLGQTGRAYLVDDRGRYVTLPPGVASTPVGTAAGSEGVRRAVTGENGSATYQDPQGTTVLGVYRWLPEVNLGLLVEMDKAELTGQIRYIWLLIALGNLLALAIGAIVARSLANRFVAPLEQIADTARTLRAGDLSSRTPLGSTEDEIGQLAVAFNEMADSLQQSQENLAQLVAERTAALERTEARLKGVVESAPDAIISVDAEQHIIMFNKAAEGMFGWASSEAIGQHVSTLIPEHSRPIHEAHVNAFAQSPEQNCDLVVDGAMYARRRNGEEFPIEAAISKVYIGGQLILTVIIRDITERKKMEEALLLRTEELQTVFDTTPVPLFVVDSGRRIWQMNKAAQDFSNASAGEMLGKRVGPALRCLHHLDVPEGCGFGPACKHCVIRNTALEAFRTRKPIFGKEGDFSARVDGEYVIRDIRVGAAFFEGEAGPRVVVAVEDVTQQKQTEKALRERNRALKESQEYSRNVIDSSLDTIITVDLDRRIVAFNKAAQDIFGYRQEEVVGQPIDVLYADPEEGRAVHDTTVEQGSCRQEVLNKRKDGQTFPALISASVLRDAEGAPVGVMGVSRDVTEQKRAEEVLRRRTTQLETLRNAGLEMSAQLEMGELVQSVVRAAVQLLEGTAGRLCLYRQDQSVLEAVVGPGESDSVRLGTDPQCAGSLCGTIWQTKKSLIVQDRAEWIGAPSNASAVGVPIRWGVAGEGGEFLGTLLVESDRPSAFSSQDVDLLDLFATQAAIAIRNAQLYSETGRRAAQMAVVHNLGQQITSLLNVDELSQRAAHMLQEQFGYLTVQIYLLDPKANMLVARGVAHNVADQEGLIEQGYRQKVGTGVTGKAAQRGEKLLIRDVSQEPDFIPCVPGIQAELALPIRGAGKVVGVLNVESDQLDGFDEADVIALEALAGQLGAALENARLYEQARQDAGTKALLLREVNHRVGNNLTAIAGMLVLARQELHTSDPVSHQATIRNLEQRVTSLSTVHNMLSASEWSPLRLNELAEKIIHESLRALSPQKRVSVSVTPSDVRVAPDLAHNLALVINELATNTVKYALRDRTTTHIAVSITQDGDDITITFRDDGPGYPEDVLRLGRHGVGLDFVGTVIRRSLRGELEIRNDDGAVTVMRFKREA